MYLCDLAVAVARQQQNGELAQFRFELVEKFFTVEVEIGGRQNRYLVERERRAIESDKAVFANDSSTTSLGGDCSPSLHPGFWWEAMKATRSTREHEFVFGGKAAAKVEAITPEIVQPSVALAAPVEQTPVTSTVAPAVKAAPAQNVGRTPISTRIRTDLSNALKKASLERQLSGTEPNTLTDILEIAVEHWLTTNGHLPKAS